LAKQKYADLKGNTLKTMQQEFDTSVAELKAQRNQALSELNAKTEALRSESKLYLERGGKGLQEAQAEGKGIYGKTESLKSLSDELQKDMQLGVASADQTKIYNTLKQLESPVESGTLSITDAQTFYKNLGKQTHKGIAPDITGTVAQFNKRIQNVLAQYIEENGGDAGKKWLKANEDYFIGKKIEKKLKSPEYKSELKAAQKEIELEYKRDLKEAEKKYHDARKSLEKETFEDYQKAQQQEAIRTASATALQDLGKMAIKQGAEYTLLSGLVHMLGGPHYITQIIKGGTEIAKPMLKGIYNGLKIIKDHPEIRAELKKAAQFAQEGNQLLFNATLLRVEHDIRNKQSKKK